MFINKRKRVYVRSSIIKWWKVCSNVLQRKKNTFLLWIFFYSWSAYLLKKSCLWTRDRKRKKFRWRISIQLVRFSLWPRFYRIAQLSNSLFFFRCSDWPNTIVFHLKFTWVIQMCHVSNLYYKLKWFKNLYTYICM